MSLIQKEGNYYRLTIEQELVSEAYLQRFLELLQFRALKGKNQMQQVDANELADQVKQSWWSANKQRFLEE
jgi:hypothetical protein